PNSPFLHPELATLYGDCITNDYRAIYHYNRYLELAKALSPDDRKTIHSYIAVCKERAAKKLLADNPSIAPTAATVPAEVSSQIQALQDQIDAYKTQLNTVSGKYLELLKKYKDLAAKTTATAPVRTAAAPTADAIAQ
ncbi:MAG: hypothetical protein J6Q65_04890, partial [Lentisphaeria bacterium]|nr:hypothetical protein [Lentisphaeria bacterium]